MRSLLAMLFGVVVLAPLAPAQFSQFQWTLDDLSGGTGAISDSNMALDGLTLPSGASVSYTTVPTVAGRVSVRATVIPNDGVCTHDGLPASIAMLLVDSQSIPFATCTFSGTVGFDVPEGQPFGFALKALYERAPYITTFDSFTFSPYWASLGGALPGAGGAPELKGSGVLQPGEVVSLTLSGAAPHAQATLIAGVSAANIPFKGGVLVPTLDLVMPGFVTNALGTLKISAVWPLLLPAPIQMQVWIVDPTASEGVSASNGLRAFNI